MLPQLLSPGAVLIPPCLYSPLELVCSSLSLLQPAVCPPPLSVSVCLPACVHVCLPACLSPSTGCLSVCVLHECIQVHLGVLFSKQVPVTAEDSIVSSSRIGLLFPEVVTTTTSRSISDADDLFQRGRRARNG